MIRLRSREDLGWPRSRRKRSICVEDVTQPLPRSSLCSQSGQRLFRSPLPDIPAIDTRTRRGNYSRYHNTTRHSSTKNSSIIHELQVSFGTHSETAYLRASFASASQFGNSSTLLSTASVFPTGFLNKKVSALVDASRALKREGNSTN